jgi:glutaredoxin-related protein
MIFPTLAASTMVCLACLVSGVDAFTTEPSLGRMKVSFSSSLSSTPNSDDEPLPNEQTLSTPEEMEEFLNKLAAKLQSELPDEPVKDKMTLIKGWAGDYDNEATRKRLQKQIDEHDVLIFGFTSCQYTKEAKEILKDQGAKFMARDFDTLPPADGYALRAELATMLNRPEVPAIFIKGQFVGGVNDGPGIKSIVAEGKLNEMLAG